MRVHHLGIIVKDMNKAINIYERLGYIKTSDIIYDYNQNIELIFLQSEDGKQVIELVKALDYNSSIYNIKEGYHHICYEIENTSEFLEYFKELKIGKIFTNKIKAPALGDRDIIFGYLRNGVFIEFIL